MRGALPSPSSSCKFFLCLVIFSLTSSHFIHTLSHDDLNLKKIEAPPTADDADHHGSSAEWYGFGNLDCRKSEEELDPGSRRPSFEFDSAPMTSESHTEFEALYFSDIRKIMSWVSSGDVRLMEEGPREIEKAAESGYPAGQSVTGFLYGMGHLREEQRKGIPLSSLCW